MAISDPPFAIPVADGGPDDLPRTLRREREARERQAREMRERAHADAAAANNFRGFPRDTPLDAALPGTVNRLDVPFFHLMGFFMKAVFAAVPALVVLALLVWSAGRVLQTWFPDLVRMQILILFPPG